MLILSSIHVSVESEKNNARKSETISFYNSNKFGVHVAEKMNSNNPVKSKSRRWPLQVLFNILDLTWINARILYKETTGERLSQ